jgi:branched-chain amino acid transport system substrate-binding protein
MKKKDLFSKKMSRRDFITRSGKLTGGAILASSLLRPFGNVLAAQKAEVEEWEIPVIICLTGGYASSGIPAHWAFLESQKDINAAGGIAGKPLRLVFYDSATNPAVATAATAKMLDRKPLIVPVYDAGPQSLAEMELISKKEVFAIMPAAGADANIRYRPWNTGWQNYDEIYQPAADVAWIKRNPDIKTVVPILDGTMEYYVTTSRARYKVFEEAGVKVLKEVSYEQFAQVDFGPVAVTALAQKADGYIFTSFGYPVALTIKQMHNRGFTENRRINIAFCGNYPELYKLGGEAVEGCYVASVFDFTSGDPRWVSIKKRYEAWTDDQMYWGIWLAYEMPYWVKHAIEETGVTGNPDKLRKEQLMLAHWSYNNPGYPFLGFTAEIVNGMTIAPIFLNVIENNKMKLVEKCPTPREAPEKYLPAPQLPPIPA